MSVVQMARAVVSHASWLDVRVSCAVGILDRILEMGRLQVVVSYFLALLILMGLDTYRCPITPVLMTSVLGSLSPLHSSTFAPILTASSRPPFPVTAFAHPELITTDRISCPCRLCSVFRLTCTGAAWNLFVVNTAAAEHGSSDEIRARSGNLVLDAFTPTCVPDTTKPLGYVPDVGMNFFFDCGMDMSNGTE